MHFDVRSYDDHEAADSAAAFAVNCGLFSEFARNEAWSDALDVVPCLIACEIAAQEDPSVDHAFELAASVGLGMSRSSFEAIFNAMGQDGDVLRSMVNDVIEHGSVRSSDVRPAWARDLALDPGAVMAAAIVADAVAYASHVEGHSWMTEVSSTVAETIRPDDLPVLQVRQEAIVEQPKPRMF